MALAGCGGNVVVGSGDLDPESLTARFIDSTVSGLEYDAGDTSNPKITNSSGKFSYLPGETLTFYVRNQANFGILDDGNFDLNATYNINVAFVKANQTINVTEGDFGAVKVCPVIRRTGDLELGFVTKSPTILTNGDSAGSDYYSVVDNQVEFLSGQIEKVVTVGVRGDNTVDSEEQFGVNLTGVSATEAVTATLDIRPVFIELDDDDITMKTSIKTAPTAICSHRSLLVQSQLLILISSVEDPLGDECNLKV